MNDARRKRIEELYQEVVNLPPAARELLLHEHCVGDDALRAEVQSLVAHYDAAASGFLASPAVARARAAQAQPPGAHAGEEHTAFVPAEPAEIGPYRIVEKVGEGGFGVVYVADQSKPVRRRVALKVLKEGMDTREVLARFEAERQALALMDHPNIAKVLDTGATATGRPYFVMELVKGEPLLAYCDRQRLSLRARIELFVPVCHAVQHAHQKGIIHRDLKPTNILVTVVDGQSTPKVIDFGIAKATAGPLTDKTVHTLHGQLMGTPVYMSPEQAERTGLDVDTTTDVYSLGAILYELLTGRLPLAHVDLLRDGLGGIGHRIRTLEPSPPSVQAMAGDAESASLAALRGFEPHALARELRGDLDWIVMRALEKDRTRRYQGANLLALELQRHLRDEPVEAGPPEVGYRLRKFVRRHRAAMGVAAAVLFGVVGAAAGLTVALIESNRQRTRIEHALDDARRARGESESVTDFMSLMLESVGPDAGGREVTVRQVLDEAARGIGQQFAQQPLVEAQLRTTIGRTYRQLGEFVPAERHLRWALEARSRALGSDNLQTLESLRELGELHHQQGDYAAAESLFVTVLARRRQLLGETDPATLASTLDLASVWMMQERDAQAIPVLERALAAARSELGVDHPTTLDAGSNLAVAYQTLGRFDEAEASLRDVLDTETRLFGAEHMRTLATKQNLAALHRQRGQYGQAEPLYAASAEGARRALGDEHPTTLRYASNLALLYSDMGRFEPARALTQQVLDAKRRVLGDDNPSTLATTINLALLQTRTGDFQECEALCVPLIERARRVFGETHTHTVTARALLATAYLGLGRAAQAEPIFREVLQQRQAAQPSEPFRVAIALSQHGEALGAMRRFDEAEPKLLEGHRMLREALGEAHAHTQQAAARVREFYKRWGKPQPKAAWEASQGG